MLFLGVLQGEVPFSRSDRSPVYQMEIGKKLKEVGGVGINSISPKKKKESVSHNKSFTFKLAFFNF